MNRIEIAEDLEKYVYKRYTSNFPNGTGEVVALYFPNGYGVLVEKEHCYKHVVLRLFKHANVLGKALYFKNKEDLNVFLRETLDRR